MRTNPITTSASLPARALAAAITLSIASASAEASPDDARWPQFRGPAAHGVDDSHPLPVAWDVEEDQGIAWRTPIEGLSHASPIVWGDRIYVVTAIASGLDPELKVGLYGAGDSADDMVEHSFRLLCLDRQTGAVLWDEEAVKTRPQFARHTKATHANSTPATDGHYVVALFGSEGLYCYSADGAFRWMVRTGPFDVGPYSALDLEWGFASSPVIADGKVIVQSDVKESPHLTAYDLETGQVVWQVDRDDVSSWSTPTVLSATASGEGGDEQDGLVLVNGCKHLGGYRLEDGAEVWRMAGGGGIPVPTPVVDDGLIYLTSNHRPLEPSHPQKPIFVVRADATGDLGVPSVEEPGEHLQWMQTRYGTYMQTPVIYRGLAYFCKDNGVVSAFDAKTGEHKSTVRLGNGRTGFSASPVAGDGKLYFTGESGTVFVLAGDGSMEILEMSWMDEICMATPAIAAGQIIFRTRDHVVCIATIGADG